MGFQVLLGQLQDLLLAQHVEVHLGHPQGRVLRLGDHGQTLGLGGSIGPGHVAADIEAVKQHLAQADPGLLTGHGIIDRLRVGRRRTGRGAVGLLVANAATQIDGGIVAALGSIMLVQSCLIEIKSFLDFRMGSQ
ncbi:hypothetical protein D3C76_617690 [compost metagenome]